MQPNTSPLLLLVVAAAAAAARELKCYRADPFTSRTFINTTTLRELVHTQFARPEIEELEKAPKDELSVCAADASTYKWCIEWIEQRADGMYVERRTGCWTADRRDVLEPVVRHYCTTIGDGDDRCFFVPMYDFDYDSHFITYLCCCNSHDYCKPEPRTDAERRFEHFNALALSPPPSPPVRRVCRMSMQQAATLDGLRNAAERHAPGRQQLDELCEESGWSPCADLVYRAANHTGDWYRWRAGCRYGFGNRTYEGMRAVDYADVVSRFCTNNNESCHQLFMVHPDERRVNRHNGLVYAYMCCCDTDRCTMQTVDYAAGLWLPGDNTVAITTGTAVATTTEAPTTTLPTTASSVSTATDESTSAAAAATTTTSQPSHPPIKCRRSEVLCASSVCYSLFDGGRDAAFIDSGGCVDHLLVLPHDLVVAICLAQPHGYCFMATDSHEHDVKLCCCHSQFCSEVHHEHDH